MKREITRFYFFLEKSVSREDANFASARSRPFETEGDCLNHLAQGVETLKLSYMRKFAMWKQKRKEIEMRCYLSIERLYLYLLLLLSHDREILLPLLPSRHNRLHSDRYENTSNPNPLPQSQLMLEYKYAQ